MPEGTYVELVRSLFRTVLPTSIMVSTFAATGVLVSVQTQDRTLAALTVLGMLAGIARLSVLLLWRRQSVAQTLSLLDARSLERRFPFEASAMVKCQANDLLHDLVAGERLF
jgi:hypothetical protein